MPEGDTLHNLARRIRGEILGEPLLSAWSRAQGPLPQVAGKRIERIYALGKNLILDLEAGYSFHVHLGIAGRCERLGTRRPGSSVTLVIETATTRLGFRKAPQARLHRTAHLLAEPGLRHLGPDLLGAEVDFDRILHRLDKPARATLPLGVVLLDQRVAAGIGNVYKSELLFLERLDPFVPLRAVGAERLLAVYRLARELMQQNLTDEMRTTVPASVVTRDPTRRHWVYGCTHAPCLRCGSTILSQRQGHEARMTYHCGGCQREGR
ncbi:MAG: hypothetical protein R3B72_11575 [Polyangiaceae bacterium]